MRERQDDRRNRMMTDKKQHVSLRQAEPGTFWFRVGLVLVAGVLSVWLATSFAMARFFPPQWILTVTEPEEGTGFSRAFRTREDCAVPLSRWQAEADRFRREGKPALAPRAACARL
jgi:hypothetical protein